MSAASVDFVEPQVSYYQGKSAPERLLEWRHKIFVEEKRFLSSEKLVDQNDDKGVHILLESPDNKTVLGATHIMLAEESDFAFHTGLQANELIHGVYSSRSFVNPAARYRGYFSLLIYLGMRWGRMQGRSMYYGYMEQGQPPIRKMLNPHIMTDLPERTVKGHNDLVYSVIPSCGTIDHALYRC